jgi:cytoskeletal protein RodZ
MSLVSEALRKARQEAAKREGRERGIPRGLVVPPKRWNSGPGLSLAILIALAAAIAGAGLAWWALGRRSTPATASIELTRPAQGPPVPSAREPAPAAPSAAAAQGRRQPAESPASVAKAQDRALAAVAIPQPQGAAAVTTTSPAPQTGGAQPTSGTPAEEPGKQRERAEGGSRERSFVVDADLGYAKLHLDYVVYRPTSPFAGINGQQVIIGSVIEGLQVEEIGPESVRLHDRRGAVVLRVH